MAAPPQRRPNPAKIADEQARCFQLKLKGASVRAIAAHTGLPRSTVQDRLNTAYDELVLPLAAQSKAIELERLDGWLHRLEDQLDNGEAAERIVPVLLRVSERRARLMGLDAPERQEMVLAALPVDPGTVDVLAAGRARAEAIVAELRAGS